MAEHPGYAVQRILRAYERNGPTDGLPYTSPRSPWASLRHQTMAERAIMQLAGAPLHHIDRAALHPTEEVLQRRQDYNAYVHDDLAPAALAGYVVGLDAVMRARSHRPSQEYLHGTQLLLGVDAPAGETAAMLAAASDDRLRGIADHLTSQQDPATGHSTRGEVIDAGGGDTSHLADLINAEITVRNTSRTAPLPTVALCGRRSQLARHPRVGQAVRVPVSTPPVPPAVVYPRAGHELCLRTSYRPAAPPPTHLTGVIIAVHPADPPDGRSDPLPAEHGRPRMSGMLTVQVAGLGAVTVPAHQPAFAAPFQPVELVDDHGQVTDPLHSERLLSDLTAWFVLDVNDASTPDYGHSVDHDRLAEALAEYSGQPVLDLMARIQHRVDYRPLAGICTAHPQLRRVSSLFPQPHQADPVNVAALDTPARSTPSGRPTGATATPPSPAKPPHTPQRRGPSP